MNVEDLNPEQVMVCGDTHGCTSHWYGELASAAKKFGVQVIIELGDFGYWVHTDDGKKFIRKLSKLLVRENLWVFWLPGNHENWDYLDNLGYNQDWSHWHEIAERIYYLPPGVRWEWQGKKLLAVGGAHSVDKDWRLEREAERRVQRKLWWPQEMISPEDVANASNGGSADVLFSHDVPHGVDLQGLMHTQGKPMLKVDGQSLQNRQRLRQIVEAVQPTEIYAGHYHARFGTDYIYNRGKNRARVNVYNCEETGRESWGIIDLTRVA